MSELASPTAVPKRFQTKHFIDDHAYKIGMRSASEPRQRKLLEWLQETDADSTDIIRWMQGRGIELYRQEDPAIVLISSLPTVENFCEPAIRGVLSKRVAEAITWLATDTSDSSEWNRLAEDTWLQLFVLIRRLGVSDFKLAVIKLFERCDRERSTPFKHDSEVSRMFTRFVMVAQPNNSLEDRWIELIKGHDDCVLKASMFEAFRGLLSMSNELSDTVILECLSVFENRIFDAFSDEQERSAKKTEFLKMIESQFKPYSNRIRNALAHIDFVKSRTFQWVTDEERVYWGDHAALAQIATQPVSSQEIKLQQERARKRYGELCPLTLKGGIVQFVTEPDRKGLAPGDHRSPEKANNQNSKRNVVCRPQTLDIYKEQLFQG